MLHPVHKVPPPLHYSNGASTSKVQSMPHTPNGIIFSKYIFFKT